MKYQSEHLYHNCIKYSIKNGKGIPNMRNSYMNFYTIFGTITKLSHILQAHFMAVTVLQHFSI